MSLIESNDKGSAFDDVNWAWLLPLLLFLPTLEPPKRREITINAQASGKSVNITYDPHDAEAVKAAEAWRKALFISAARWTYEEPIAVCPGDSVTPREYVKDAVQKGFRDMQQHIDRAIAAMEPWTPRKRMTELEKASEPLRDYLRAHGDPHTSVVVTQDGATETQDERRVTFDGEKPAEAVNRNPDNVCFPYTLPKDVVKAWSAIALEWHEISRAQKDGKECVKIYEKLVTDATIFQKNLKAALDEARQFPTV